MDIFEIPHHALIVSDRIFVALRKMRQPPGSRRPVYHAVTPHCRVALCCAEPGASSGWAEPPAVCVTCPACVKRLEALANRAKTRRQAKDHRRFRRSRARSARDRGLIPSDAETVTRV